VANCGCLGTPKNSFAFLRDLRASVVNRFLLTRNPDNCHHATRLAELRAMRKEARDVTCRAAVYSLDLLVFETGIQKLTTIGFHKIKMDFRCRVTVPGRTLIEKKQRIFHMQ